jgi:hypothetical protein
MIFNLVVRFALQPRDPSTVCYSRNLISRVTNPPINILGTEGSTRDTEEDRAIGEVRPYKDFRRR